MTVRMFAFLLFAASLSLAQAEKSSSTIEPRYDFTLETTPRYQFQGIGLLSPDAAAIANCYRLTDNSSGHLAQIDYLKANVLAPDPTLGVASIVFTYAPGIERRSYLNAAGQPTMSISQVYGEELSLAPNGSVLRITNLDATGKPIADGFGVVQYARTVDAEGRVTALRRLNEQGQPITDTLGYFETRTIYDNRDNPVDYSNYDANGNLLNNADGYASIRRVFTVYPDTTLVIESYFDASGQTVAEPKTGAHMIRDVFDNRHFLLSESYFDDRGGPILNKTNRCHEHQIEYDDAGNIVTQQYFDTNGQLKELKTTGYAKVTYQYDNLNRIIEREFFGDDGKPTVSRNGAAIIREEYDNQGRLSRRQFFDEHHNPIVHAKYGAPAVRITYANGRTLYSLRDAQDQPAIDPVHGYSAYSTPSDVEDPPLGTVYYFNVQGHRISPLRYKFLNPYLALLHAHEITLESARVGLGIVLLGSFITAVLALRKAVLALQQRVIIPGKIERILALLGIFLIGEGLIRFGLTLWWFWGEYLQATLTTPVYLIEPAYILFFAYRFWRLRRTLRIYNITKADLLQLLESFFAHANWKAIPKEQPLAYLSDSLDLRINYLRDKQHAALSFFCRNSEGLRHMQEISAYLREKVATMQGPVRNLIFRFYYPLVAVGYSVLLGCVLYAFLRLFT